MKKSKKFIIGVVLIFVGAVGLLGLFQETESKFTLAFGSFVFIGIGILLILLDKKYQTQNKKEEPQIQLPKKTEIPEGELNYNLFEDVVGGNALCYKEEPQIQLPKKTEIPEGELNYNLFDDIVDGNALCYKYEENICIIDNNMFDLIPGNGGKTVTFKQELDNPHDKNAVAIYLEGDKIGYIYRGKIQDMFNDFAKRGDLVLGYLNKYSIPERTATYKIGFYKPLSKFESRQFSLIKIHTKPNSGESYSRAEALSLCEIGDNLDVNYDHYSGSYEVCGFVHFSFSEIGELPASASNFIPKGECKKLSAIIDDINIEEDDNGDIIKAGATVTVYIIR